MQRAIDGMIAPARAAVQLLADHEVALADADTVRRAIEEMIVPAREAEHLLAVHEGALADVNSMEHAIARWMEPSDSPAAGVHLEPAPDAAELERATVDRGDARGIETLVKLLRPTWR